MWEPCEYCGGEKTLYQSVSFTELFMDMFGDNHILLVQSCKCPPFAGCTRKNLPVNAAFKINFCPECGRPLNEKAREMLKKRISNMEDKK